MLSKNWNSLKKPGPNRWFWLTTAAMTLIVLGGWLYPLFRLSQRTVL